MIKIAYSERSSGVVYHRLRVPLRNFPDQIEVFPFKNPNELNGKDFHVVILNRSFGLSNNLDDLNVLTGLWKSGVKIIIDIDDNWDLPEHHTIRWRSDINYTQWRDNIVNNLHFADLVWTSTDEIKTKVEREYPNKPVIVVRNVLDKSEEMWQFKNPLWKKDNKVHIGYVGGNTHYMDLAHIKDAIAKINKYHSKKIMWHQCGYENVTDHGKRVSRQIAFTLSKNTNNYRPHGGKPIDEYGYFYDGLDISIAPLANNEFNECKSELKILEAGQKGCAFIGQDMVTYSRFDGDVELAGSASEWYEAIMHYVDNRNDLEDYKSELRESVKKYSMVDENMKRIESIVNLLGGKMLEHEKNNRSKEVSEGEKEVPTDT